METQTIKTPIKFLKDFDQLFINKWRNIAFYGGRYSGKSYHIALALLLRGRKDKLRILCTREIQNTIRDSVHKLLKDLIDTYGFNDYGVTNEGIYSRYTGTEFIFKGLRRNVNEIKSTEGIDICWVEEAQSVTDDSLNILAPTIRKEGSQIIFSFNRFTELDPVYVKYVMNNPERTFSKKVNYDVLEREGLLTDAILTELAEDKKDPELFAHKWLGEPVGQAEFSVIGRNTIMEAMQREISDDGAVEIGVDVARMGGDRTTFWKRKGLKTIQKEVHTKLRTTEVCDLLEQFAQFNKQNLIKVDDTGVGGGVTDEMMKRGYNVLPINFGGEALDKDKYPNWISEAWFHLKEIMPEVQLPLDNDLLMELSTRQWRQDVKGRRQVESKNDYKKRGFRSPDIADACIICYYSPERQFNAATDFIFV